MLRSFLRIGQRITAGYLILLSLIFVVGAAGLIATETVVQSAAELYDHPFAVVDNLLGLRASLLRMDGVVTQALAYPETARAPGWFEEISRQEQEADGFIAMASQRYLGPVADSQGLRIAWSDWRAVVDPILSALARGEVGYARELYRTTAHPQFVKVTDAQEVMLTFARSRAQTFNSASLALRGQQRWHVGLLMLTALVLGGVVTFLINRSILSPLARLRLGLATVTEGEGQPAREDLERGDEIGEMAREMEALRLSVQSRKRAELKYQTLFRNCPDIIIVSHRETSRFLEVNDAFERLLGYSRQEAVGHMALDMGIWVVPDERTHILDSIAASDRVSGVEVHLRRKDGEVLMAMMSLERVELDGQDCMITVSRDISDRKREEETLRRMVDELAQSNAELARFAHIAAHDLQEPSRSICSYAQLLERRHGAEIGDEGREYLAFLVAGAYRMRDLVSGLLTYSRAGTRASSFRKVELESLFTAIEVELHVAITEHQAVVERDGPLPTVFGDPVQLQQLFTHLLSNALKFQQEGALPKITISAKGDGDWWHLSIRDNGIGIAADHQEQVFEMFRRLHGPGRYPGSGLGLALARRIVEAHGGRIWLESKPGLGTVVHLTLPADKST
jgi:PAS domain S-box-containing protein